MNLALRSVAHPLQGLLLVKIIAFAIAFYCWRSEGCRAGSGKPVFRLHRRLEHLALHVHKSMLVRFVVDSPKYLTSFIQALRRDIKESPNAF